MSESQKTAASQDVKMEVEKNRNRAALRRTFLGRVIRSVVVAFWVMVIAFSLIRLSPGDPVRMALGADVTEEAVEEFRTQLGLDKESSLNFGITSLEFSAVTLVTHISQAEMSQKLSVHTCRLL